MTSHRLPRLAAAGLLIGVVIGTLAPRLAGPAAPSSLVNAPLISILSPIAGRIRTASAPAGAPVAAGQQLLQVESEPDPEIQAELQARRAELAAKDRQSRALKALRDTFAARERTYRAALAGWLDARLAEAAAEQEAARVTRDETASRIARSRNLAGQGALAQAGLEHDEAELARADAAVAGAGARLEAVRRERAALDSGLQIQGEASYSRSRIDEVTLRLTDLEAERDRLAAEEAALAARLAASAQARFAPVATAPGTVWRASGAVGTAVAPGDEILQLVDCAQRFLEVPVPDGAAPRAGDAVQVALRGRADPVAARIAAIRGSGGGTEPAARAVTEPELPPGRLRALVALAPPGSAPPPADPAFCDLGRAAEIRFDGPAAGPWQSLAGLGRRLAGWIGGRGDQTAAR
ncbi:MAG: HlyD family efflux transporter periplasmic adaptor subunit [Amaricoccus sp.]